MRRFFVAWLVGAPLVAGCFNPQFPPNGGPVMCTVLRRECVQEGLVGGQPMCTAFDPPPGQPLVPFTATHCIDVRTDASAGCKDWFCNETAPVYGYGSDCDATGARASAAALPIVGSCQPDKDSTHTHMGSVTFVKRSRVCTLSSDNVSCSSLAPAPQDSGTMCFDLSYVDSQGKGGAELILTPSSNRDASVNLVQVVPNDQNCPLTPAAAATASPAPVTYELAPGSIGTASGAGSTVALTAVRGVAVMGQVCGDDVCQPSLDHLRVDLADTTVAGASLTALSVENVGATAFSSLTDPDSKLATIETGALQLIATGRINGQTMTNVVKNDSTWKIGATGTTFSLQGNLSVLGRDLAGHSVKVTVAANLSGHPATAATRACLALSPIQRLFGFEDVGSWSSSNASLSLITTPVTQGCGALGVQGQGYLPINGASFPTAGLATTPALSVDLFIPGNQPNPNYLGALQMYLSCPTGNVFNQYIGQVELTGKPQNHYSTLRFPLPTAVSGTLGRDLSDCAFSFALNANNTNRTWILDNLRFTP